ncbi:MAG: type III pantothenate kinase, partial [Bdellovibrionales bacterium]|nr:type III pantothenate kinase [Oligoflexia bacterium]
FVLQAGVKTGLKIKYRNPLEVGADRIANSIAAIQLYPGRDVVIVDLGTATTFCAVTRDKDYLGGAIIPGLRISMEALESRTAKLPSVEIVRPEVACGRSTIESIQSGLYYSHLGAMRELIGRYQKELFNDERPFVIGTGGFSRLFQGMDIFDAEIPDLVLYGLLSALRLNDGDASSQSSGAI